MAKNDTISRAELVTTAKEVAEYYGGGRELANYPGRGTAPAAQASPARERGYDNAFNPFEAHTERNEWTAAEPRKKSSILGSIQSFLAGPQPKRTRQVRQAQAAAVAALAQQAYSPAPATYAPAPAYAPPVSAVPAPYRRQRGRRQIEFDGKITVHEEWDEENYAVMIAQAAKELK